MARKGKREKTGRGGKRQQRESLTKGVVGKFSIGKKPDRFERAKKIESWIGRPEGIGTGRSLGSEQALKDKIEALKGRSLISTIRKKRKRSRLKGGLR